jgi:uncharacterized DUF497 family protein
MRYSWDREKNRRNLIRHGIAFDDAVRIFDGPTVEKVDDRFDYRESRDLCSWLGERLGSYSGLYG